MKTKWIMSLLVVVVAGGLAFGVSHYLACKTTGTVGLDRLRDLTFLERELKLTDAQISRIKALHGELAAQLDSCTARHCGARMRMGKALSDGTNIQARADALLAEMCSAYEDSERATLNHILQVRALLDERQQERFDTLITACLCQSCPRCEAVGGCMGLEGEGH